MPETKSAITPLQKTAFVKVVCEAIIDAVAGAGEQGAPGGILYAALMQHGFSFQQFETIMGTLVRIGELEKRGQCYFVKDSARVRTGTSA